MLLTQTHHSHPARNLVPWHKPFISGTGGQATSPLQPKPSFRRKQKECVRFRYVNNTSANIKAMSSSPFSERPTITSVKAVVTFLNLNTDFVGKSILLELVSAELDRETGLEKETIKGSHQTNQDENEVKYEWNFDVPEDFGDIGAVLVKNEHRKEMYLKEIAFDGLPNGPINVTCNSWVASKSHNPQKRIFFTNKQSYLPSQTPNGLMSLRKKELKNLRGDGQGERRTYDRIYDYDVYNDIGNPDSDIELKRPVLGGKEHPYPRRCRTGRPQCREDPLSESGSSGVYVPRDEAFSAVKEKTFLSNAGLHALFPLIEAAIGDTNLGFPHFTAIDSLFIEGVSYSLLGNLKQLISMFYKLKTDSEEDVFTFETPALLKRDKFSWFRDEEFSRQTLAGLNPYSIQLVKEWPLMSKLDPNIYGTPESAITKELIEQEIGGFITLDQALQQKKLFMVDYHDLLLPYVKKVREIEGTTLYGSRALFFLTPDGTLRPLAIELTRPPVDGRREWKQVFTPAWNATGCWLWRFAKTHFLAHDSGYHQLVSHWLRTHCTIEPYIIASNRQLSAMHPIYKLLHPHFRYTMAINALARVALINADGIIETSFSPAKYSMELSSAAYDQQWQFNHQALPADLISRGMAVVDPTSPHGLKLTIEDYPFANDGLLLWDAIKQWVTDYVKHYYPDSDPKLVKTDEELQAWWTEIRTVGHGDKKDDPGWPALQTPDDLIGILTTMIWVASGHHSAVNFGQYAFAGYMPNRPTIARRKMPTEDPSEEDLKRFLNEPEDELLRCYPSQFQATKVMGVLDVLSNHSVDEEYIGKELKPAWTENQVVKAAFERFNERLNKIERMIDDRNANMNLKNRNGAGMVPYELLKPFSGPGVTGKGVPNSISI